MGDDISGGGDQVDTAMEPPVVEPVGADCRHSLGLANRVDDKHERMVTGADATGDLKRKGPEPTLVGAELLTVQPHSARMVDGTKVNKASAGFRFHDGERSAVPERPFVVVKLRNLCIPVAGT